jgi:hypothetical protein
MTAPKRIWVEKQIAEPGIHGSTAWPETDCENDIEYIRADLVAELVQAARDYLPQVGEPARDQKDMRLDAALRAIKETDA